MAEDATFTLKLLNIPIDAVVSSSYQSLGSILQNLPVNQDSKQPENMGVCSIQACSTVVLKGG